jgi:hypothetical protein
MSSSRETPCILWSSLDEKRCKYVILVRSLPLLQFLPQIIFSVLGTAGDTWRISVLHHKRYSSMEVRLKFTAVPDRVEEIPKKPRKLKRKVFGKNGRDPFTNFRYQNETTGDGMTKTTIEDEEKTILVFIGTDRNIFKTT